jgi:hypothetical protein
MNLLKKIMNTISSKPKEVVNNSENDKVKIDDLNKKIRRINSLSDKIPDFKYCFKSNTVNYSCDSHPSDFSSRCEKTDESYDTFIFSWDNDGKLVKIYSFKTDRWNYFDEDFGERNYDEKTIEIMYNTKGAVSEILKDGKRFFVIENDILKCLEDCNGNEWDCLLNVFRCSKVGNILDYDSDSDYWKENRWRIDILPKK